MHEAASPDCDAACRQWRRTMSNRNPTAPAIQDLEQDDFAQEQMGRNALQGNDQESVRNQRKVVPEARKEADGIVEGLKKLDRDHRAETDLHKGRRSGPRSGG
ncbi:hypothetical protein STVA_39020 [Allostella vacuolata]|nr:hypothetical protein STVA_39020 [Stella vacuolata]